MAAVGINIGYTVEVFQCRGGLGVVEAREELAREGADGAGPLAHKGPACESSGTLPGALGFGAKSLTEC